MLLKTVRYCVWSYLLAGLEALELRLYWILG